MSKRSNFARMRNMESILSVHIEPPAGVSHSILRMRRAVADHGKDDPHITLYLAKINTNVFQTICKKISELRLEPVTIHLGTVKQQKSFYFVPVRKTSSLTRLHRKVLAVVNAFRGDLLREIDLERIRQGLYSRRELRNLQKYGYARVLGSFRPHISLNETSMSKNAPGGVGRLSSKLSLKEFTADSLVVALYEFDTVSQRYTRTIFKKVIGFRRRKKTR